MSTKPLTPFVRRVAIVAVATDLLFTFCSPWHGDQVFWSRWVGQLQAHGFGGFGGNYPPGYVLWLWVVGKLLAVCKIPLECSYTLKLLCVWPALLAHLAILRLLSREVEKREWEEGTKRRVLWACAVNPLLIAVGPSWGQIDLLPTVLILLALVACFEKRFASYTIPLFVAGVLIKLQMIAFSPVLAALQLRRIRDTWRGIPIAAALVVVVFLPFLLTGGAHRLVDNAYIHVGSQYPYGTFNAANLWMLLGSNKQSWARLPFMGSHEAHQLPLALLTPNYLGKILFVGASAAVFKVALRVRRLSQAAMLATLIAASFFVLLPAMHERYLLMAIPVSLLWLATDARAFPWVAVLTTIGFVNVGMRHSFGEGNLVWKPLSAVAVVTFGALVVRTFAPRAWERGVARLRELEAPVWVPDALLVTSLVACLFVGFLVTRPRVLRLPKSEVWLSSLPLLEHHQAYGDLQFDKSVDGHPLKVDGVYYQNGIGTHATSDISFQLPANAKRFSARVGLDEETGSGKLAFVVKLDDVEIWRSRPLRQRDKPVVVSLSVSGGQKLTLATDSLGNKKGDHADWLEPRIHHGP